MKAVRDRRRHEHLGLSLLPGDFTAATEALLEIDPEWNAPVLWRSEFRNILAGFMRRDMLQFDQACSIQQEAEGLLEGAEHEPASRSVLKLVAASNCSAYDCEFVALANALRVPFYTMDSKVLAAFPAIARSLPGL